MQPGQGITRCRPRHVKSSCRLKKMSRLRRSRQTQLPTGKKCLWKSNLMALPTVQSQWKARILEEVVEPTPKCFRHFAVGPLTGRFVVHNVSKLVHYSDPSFVDGRGARTISCGRSLNQNYKYITQIDSVDVCKRCKSNAVKDGALPKAFA